MDPQGIVCCGCSSSSWARTGFGGSTRAIKSPSTTPLATRCYSFWLKHTCLPLSSSTSQVCSSALQSVPDHFLVIQCNESRIQGPLSQACSLVSPSWRACPCSCAPGLWAWCERSRGESCLGDSLPCVSQPWRCCLCCASQGIELGRKDGWRTEGVGED